MRDERAIVSGNIFDFFVLPNSEPVMIGNAAIIFQRLSAHRLFIQRRHGNIAYFEQFRRREKYELGRVVVDRIYDAAFIDNDDAHTTALQLDAARKASGSCADDYDVERFHATAS